MNLKCTFQLQIAILLEAEQTELEVLLATGHKLWLPPYWIFWGEFFFSWLEYPGLWAKLSSSCLHFCGCCGSFV